MKITQVDIYLIRSGRLHPVLVEVTTDEGVTGIGEAAIAYGLGATAAAGMIKDLSEWCVLGRDPFAIEALWSEMYDHSFWAKGGGGPIVYAGISAIEQALWDIKGKAVGLPVHEFLGGRMRDTVRVYANGWCFGADTPAKFGRAGEKPARDGYDAIKCYPLAINDARGTLRHVSLRSVERDHANLAFDKIKALRQAVGPDVGIMVDLSGALTTDETIRLCRRYEELDLLCVEEPADPFDVGALKKISEAVAIPIAVGERLYTRYGFRAVMEGHAADIMQPDIGNTGGIMETKKIAAMAEVYNMRVAPHNCASTLSTATALQVDACIANFMIQEVYPYFPEADGYIEVLEDPPERGIRNGTVPVPSGPGLGVTLARASVQPFLWARCTSS